MSSPGLVHGSKSLADARCRGQRLFGETKSMGRRYVQETPSMCSKHAYLCYKHVFEESGDAFGKYHSIEFHESIVFSYPKKS